MSDNSAIQWTDASWNPVVGCTRVSAGCDHCYAVKMTRRLEGMAKAGPQPGKRGTQHYVGLTVKNRAGDWHFNGQVRCIDEALTIPLRWREPRMVFVNSMSDLFHPAVPSDFIDYVFAIMALTPQHTYQILTKRPERMAEYCESPQIAIAEAAAAIGLWKGPTKGWTRSETCGDRWIPPWPLPNVWLGTSCEDQLTAEARIPHLLKCPAAVRFLSLEPLLAPIDISGLGLHKGFCPVHDFPGGFCHGPCPTDQRIGWVIVGGESGPGARPCDVAWIGSIRDQCIDAGVPVFVKQLGSRVRQVESHDEHLPAHARELAKKYGIGPLVAKITEGRLRAPKGDDISEWPTDLCVREFPATRTKAP